MTIVSIGEVSKLRVALGSWRFHKLSMTRALKSMFALAAVAVVVGRVETVQRTTGKPRNQELPPLFTSEPASVLVRACGNCHSNHTDWPWYSQVAPVSWWIAWHVRKGRERLDWSEWENLFFTATARQIGIDLRTDIDRQDATAAVQLHASGGKTQRSGKEGSVLLGEGKDSEGADEWRKITCS